MCTAMQCGGVAAEQCDYCLDAVLMFARFILLRQQQTAEWPGQGSDTAKCITAFKGANENSRNTTHILSWDLLAVTHSHKNL